MSAEQLIPREQLLKRLSISDSTERRKRQRGENWPAHICIGQRILYRESEVNTWIATQEQKGTGAGCCGGLSPELDAAIDRRATELAAQAPTLTTRQVAQLREIFAHPAGGHDQ